jgi:hypothetical protein
MLFINQNMFKDISMMMLMTTPIAAYLDITPVGKTSSTFPMAVIVTSPICPPFHVVAFYVFDWLSFVTVESGDASATTTRAKSFIV